MATGNSQFIDFYSLCVSRKGKERPLFSQCPYIKSDEGTIIGPDWIVSLGQSLWTQE